MKLIIDVPEDRYRQIKELPNAFNSDICKVIRNGIPYEERPQGEWKLHGMIYYCSECGHECGESGDNFCGNCGVKMKGGAE